MIKKIYSFGFSLLLIFCIGATFVGCKEAEIIPSGKYAEVLSSNGTAFLYSENSNVDFYIEVDGNTVKWVTSNAEWYRAKIVEKAANIYFEGYKWRDFFDLLFRDGKKQGNTDVYLVVYNKAEKSIALSLCI